MLQLLLFSAQHSFSDPNQSCLWHDNASRKNYARQINPRALLHEIPLSARINSALGVKRGAERLQTEFSTRYSIANEQKMKNSTWQKQI